MQASARNGRGAFTFRPAPPLDADLTLQRYHRWGVDPANVYHAGALHRVARVGGLCVQFRLRAIGSRMRPRIAIEFAGPDIPAVRAAVRSEARFLIGADHDLAGFYALAARDPVLAPLVRPEAGLVGLRPTIAPDPFEMLVGAIAAQQINLAFAFLTRARLVRQFGEARRLDGITVYAFPDPGALAAADSGTLRAMQFSTRKAEYIIGLARAIVEGRLDFGRLGSAPDDEVIAQLTQVRGLGRWTAEWFLARGLGRPDVCPAGDLGVRRAVEAFCFRGRRVDPARVRARARAWRPYQSLAVHYLLAGHRPDRAKARPPRRETTGA